MADSIEISSGDMTITVEGLQALQKANEALVREIAQSGNLVAKAASVIERQAKENWGHGHHLGGFPNIQTGRLRSSITTAIDSPIQARVGTNVEYAAAVEYGYELRGHLATSGFKTRSGKISFGISALSGKMSPAYPFLGPAIEQTADQMQGVMVTYGQELGAIWEGA